MVPVLVRVTTCDGLLKPIAVSAKTTGLGDSVAEAVAAIGVPVSAALADTPFGTATVREAVCGLLTGPTVGL